MISNQYIGGANGNNILGGLAISDFIDGTNNRRVYNLLYQGNSKDGAELKYYLLNDRGLSLIAGVASINTPGEFELASNNSFLAFTTPFADFSFARQIQIIEVDETGDPSWQSIYYDVETSGTEHFLGLEISGDCNYIYTGSMGVGFYKIDVSDLTNITTVDFLPVYGNDIDYTYSQIERGADGNYYVVKENGDIGYFDENFNSITTLSTGLGTNGVINNYLYSNNSVNPFNYYVIPDQIDGSNYDNTLEIEEICCLSYFESEVVNTSNSFYKTTTNDIVVVENMVWTNTSNPFTEGDSIFDIYMKGNLIVEPGAKLSIYDLNLHFNEDKGIYLTDGVSENVNGSYLYLNNTKLTAFDECEKTTMWAGISAIGSNNTSDLQVPFSSTKQPQVEMRNSSIIEYASVGIEATQGGFVRAYSGNKFINNVKDVVCSNFNIYNYTVFIQCEFITTIDIYEKKNSSPFAHLHVWNSPGIEAKGCTFKNEETGFSSLSERGTGILSSYSSLKVINYIDTPSQFENLWYGIKSNGGAYVNIEKTNFIENLGGAWVINNDALTVTECDFNVGDSSYYYDTYFETFGLYVEACTGYQIEENTFRDGLLGLVVYNSGTEENLIYRNTFSNLSNNSNATGFVGIGGNSGYPKKSTGLQLRCNNFINNDYSISLLGGNIITSSGVIDVNSSKIRRVQGFDNGSNISAFNYFNPNPSMQTEEFFVDPNVVIMYNPTDKYRYNQTNQTGYKLTYYNPLYVNTHYLSPEVCVSNLGIGIQPSSFEQLNTLSDEQTIKENEIESLTNDINEIALVIAAQTANPSNVNYVHNELLEASPYLNDTILKSYLMNNSVSEYSRTSIMLANSPLPREVNKDVKDSDLSEGLKAYIAQFQNGINELEEKHLQLESIKGNKQIIFDRLLREAIKIDSLNIYNYIENIFRSYNDDHAKRCLINLYKAQNEFDNVESELNNLLQIAELNNDNKLINYVKLKQIENEINKVPDNHFGIINSNLNYLYDLSNNYTSKEGSMARAILDAEGFIDYHPITILPPANKNKTLQFNSEEFSETYFAFSPFINLYPNPASDNISLEYISPVSNCKFSIYNSKGELVKSFITEEAIGFKSIDISDLLPGNYVLDCHSMSTSLKFVIIR